MMKFNNRLLNRSFWTGAAWLLWLGTLPGLEAKLTPEQQKKLPSPLSHSVDFSSEIKPILEASCVKCHGRGQDKGGFRVDNREEMLKGGDSGPAVLLGNSGESYFIELISGLDPDNIMPQKGSKLSEKQVALLRAWIDQGAKWDPAVSFSKIPPVNLDPPRAQNLPRAAKWSNPIDYLLAPVLKSNRVEFPNPVSDRVFSRRVYLDLIGLLPTPAEQDRFISDRRRDKRQRLVQELLGRDQAYADHWISFWNDLLRNDYRGTGYLTGGREQITYWLYGSLEQNKPYDQFVRELINPTFEASGFTRGIIWRGVVNASQTPSMQAAQNISQVFMGVNLKCASCHDSFINDWKLADAYGLANIYAESPLEMFECDRPTGKKAGMQFIYPQLGKISSDGSREERLAQLAAVITSPENGRLPRTVVNRFWQRLMGRGLVEPVDEMENQAWHPALLDWLAHDLRTNGYNLRATLAQITTSQAYQLPAVDLGENVLKNYAFRGPAIRRITAEQFRDAVGSLTGKWHPLPGGLLPTPFAAQDSPKTLGNSKSGRRAGRAVSEESLKAGAESLPAREISPLTPFDSPVSGKWIWTDANANSNVPRWTIYLRKEVWLPEKPTQGLITAVGDKRYTVYVNGKRAGGGRSWRKPELIDATEHFTKGHNLIAVEASNEPPKDADQEERERDRDRDAGLKKEEGADEKKKKEEKKEEPAGFFLHARLRQAGSPEVVMDLATDQTWIWSATKFDEWEKKNFVTYAWIPAQEIGGPEAQPWNLGEKLAAVARTARRYDTIRAGLVPADSLGVALSRPNREHVITTRAGTATTVQMLELNNGETLARLLEAGVERISTNDQLIPQVWIESVYRHALGRDPTAAETRTSMEVVGNPIQKEGMQDFLWAILMLPEFQLIY